MAEPIQLKYFGNISHIFKILGIVHLVSKVAERKEPKKYLNLATIYIINHHHLVLMYSICNMYIIQLCITHSRKSLNGKNEGFRSHENMMYGFFQIL